MQRLREDVSFVSGLIAIGAVLVAIWSHLPNQIPSVVFVGVGIAVMKVKSLWLPVLLIICLASEKQWGWAVLATAITAGLAYGTFELWRALLPAHLAEGLLFACGWITLALVNWYGAKKLGNWLYKRYSVRSALASVPTR